MQQYITRKNILILIAAICAIIMIIGAVMIITITMRYRVSANLYRDLEMHLSFPEPGEETSIPARDPIDVGDEEGEDGEWEETFRLPDHIVLPTVDFEALEEINDNVIGWIILEGTPINYPVVQGEDNDFYLRHLFDGRWNPSGSIFLDYLNSPRFTDHHTIIYGHNMQDGSMFAAIESYMYQEFYDNHPYIFLITPERRYVIKPFAGYMADTRMPSWRLQFDDAEDVATWIADRRERSDFVSNTEALPHHRFVTLSTCSSIWHDIRYVLVGRIIPIE